MPSALLAAVLAFAAPARPASACAPETWFHIIGGNASQAGIAADLAAIADAGIGGIQFFHGHADGGLWPGVTNAIPCLSESWLDLVKFTEAECHRRGLTFKMQNCPGWSMSGGPWITPDRAMRRLVCFEPGRKPAFDGDDDYHEIGRVTFAIDYPADDFVRHVIVPAPSVLNHDWAYEPGATFRIQRGGAVLRRVVCPAGNWSDTWGDAKTMTLALDAAVPSEGLAVVLEASHPVASDNWRVAHGQGRRLDNWEGKAAWTLRGLSMSTNDAPVRKVAEKTLVFGHVNAKRRNHPAPPEATGWECDKMDPRGFEANWKGYLGRILDAGVKPDGVLVDSWECGAQSWTWRMEEEFERRAGYPLRPWLPALFGYVLGSEARTERFLLDWRNVCSRLIEENYYGTIARLAHENGMTAQYETAFGDVIAGDILRYWKYADEPMCEFWSPHDDAKGFVGSHDFKPVLPCVSAAHVYGKRRVSAEALTSFALTFDENFNDWKRIIDRHFARGVTHIVFHTYTHNPVVGGRPPSTSFGGRIGSPFLRGQTWWPYLKDFTAYLARCGRELERGFPSVDILMYLGDEVNHKPSERELLFGNRYKYDYCNNDVLMTRLAVKDGRLVLPDGLTYRVLWIPENTFLLPDTAARIAALEQQGARVFRGDFTPDWPSPLAMIGRDPAHVQWYARQEGEETIFFLVEANGASSFVHVKAGEMWIEDPVTGERRQEHARTPPQSVNPFTLYPEEDYPAWATRRIYTGEFQSALKPGSRRQVILDLGCVRDWATVSVNGRVVRRLWCAPYSCDITSFLADGENEVRVEVTSTWYNRLVHDAGLPEEERTTWTLCGPAADAPQHASGLIGPATISIYENPRIREPYKG
ncbi:MAG: glycosyl hydrolase [Kiritimatiellia bacterium]